MLYTISINVSIASLFVGFDYEGGAYYSRGDKIYEDKNNQSFQHEGYQILSISDSLKTHPDAA